MPPVLTTASINSVGIPALISTTVPQPVPLPVPAPPISTPFTQDTDLRNVDPRLNRNAVAPVAIQPNMDLDMRIMPNAVPMEVFPPRGVPAPQQSSQRPFQTDPRQRPTDPRQKSSVNLPAPVQPRPAASSSIIPDNASDREKTALIMQVLQVSPFSSSTFHKIQICLLFLQLSDEQIALLPPEQRTSIKQLKDQIARTTNTQR